MIERIACETKGDTSNLEKPILTQKNNCLQHNELLMQDSCKHSENDSLSITPNYSLWKGEIIYSGRSAPKKPKLLHHAGLVLLTPWLDQVTGDLEKHRDIIRQWFAQVLLGAVNHEQSKTLAFSSLEFLVGPSVSALNHQRYLLRAFGRHRAHISDVET